MPERLVINTGPLITLARIDGLDFVGQLPFVILCPLEVRHELDAGEKLGHPEINPKWLEVRSLGSPPSSVALAGLDRGEAAVIQLALELEVSTVCIDEWKGRRAALAAGLQVTGVLGLLGMAKRRRLIEKVAPWIQRARDAGVHYHPELIDRVLEAVGENEG